MTNTFLKNAIQRYIMNDLSRIADQRPVMVEIDLTPEEGEICILSMIKQKDLQETVFEAAKELIPERPVLELTIQETKLSFCL